MKINENAQELLEKIWIVTQENGESLSNDPSSAADYDELIGLGLVRSGAAELTLTGEGVREAAMAIRRHRLAERLLADVLTTEDALVDERACGLEHALFAGVDESICTLLGHPQFCPHGKPIPPGDCCREMRSSVSRLVASLCELKPGEHGQIAYIQMNDPQRLQKLMAMGVLPGVPIKLLRTSPSFVFEACYSQFAVDEEIAADIFVRLKNGGNGK
jgi:DtxR family transcriptional regulator, Mn-dependent transcriptional regulator